MQRTDDPLISIAAAAQNLGLNRSTLTRQVNEGSIRAHGGKVRLSEVIEDRAKNINERRGGRQREANSLRAEPVARAEDATRYATADATNEPWLIWMDLSDGAAPNWSESEIAVLGAFSALFSRARPVIAAMAVEAQMPMRQVYAILDLVQMGLLGVAGEVLEDIDVKGWRSGRCHIAVRGEGVQKPDWRALAAKAGELVDLTAWEAFTSKLPFFLHGDDPDDA
jgi:hypothetical protein